MQHIQNGESGVLVRTKINSAMLKAAELKWYSDALKAKVGVDRLDLFNSIFADGTPGFRINVEEALRLNQQALGPELATQFPGDWTAYGAGWSIGAGVATSTATSNASLIQDEPLTPNALIRFELPILTRSSGSVRVRLLNGGKAVAASDFYASTGTKSFFLMNTNADRIQVEAIFGTGFVGSIGNISVREIDLSKCVAFQDSAGILPVMSVEQSLGLILDTKMGVPVRGPELVAATNLSTFTESDPGLSKTDTSFTSISLGKGVTKPITVGKWYEGEVSGSTTSDEFSVNTCNTATAPTSRTVIRLGFGRFVFLADMPFLYLRNATAGTTSDVSISLKELPGNHFVQPSNTASRPIVSRRVNLFTQTEDFAGAAWGWTGTPGTVTPNAGLAPDGTNTAIKLVITAGGPRQNIGNRTDAKFRLWVKSAGDGKDVFRLSANSSIVTGNLTATNEWQEFEFSPNTSGTGGAWGPIIGYGVDSTSILVWHPDLRLSSDVPALPPYQRVTSASDYDEVGFPAYARFDGLDDWLETGGTVDMTSTDEVTVIAGVTKFSDAAGAVFAEMSMDSNTNNGTFAVFAPQQYSSNQNLSFRSRGTSSTISRLDGIPSPYSAVLSGSSKISADVTRLRVNGIEVTSGDDLGTGNYGAHKFYIGRRAGTTFPFTGRIYSVTVIGKLLTDGQLAAAEQVERQMGRLY